jgi:hypothetical protein
MTFLAPRQKGRKSQTAAASPAARRRGTEGLPGGFHADSGAMADHESIDGIALSIRGLYVTHDLLAPSDVEAIEIADGRFGRACAAGSGPWKRGGPLCPICRVTCGCCST